MPAHDAGGSTIAVQSTAVPTRRRRIEDPTHLYLSDLEGHVRRLVCASRAIPSPDRDDVVQAVLLKAWRQLEHYQHHYPRAAVLARVLVGSVGEDHARSQRVQQGMGARLLCDGAGGRRVGRQRVAIEVRIEQGEWLLHPDVVAATIRGGIDPVGDRVAVADEAHRTVGALADQLRWSPRDRVLVDLVDGRGLTITAAARHLGIARETANRRLTQLHRQARALAADNFAVVA
jgi:RNA polymerase sigma factor (sigma-70 family)